MNLLFRKKSDLCIWISRVAVVILFVLPVFLPAHAMVDTSSSKLETSLEYGQSLVAKQKYKEAIQVFSEMINNGNEAIPTFLELANAYTLNRDRRSGLRTLSEAVRYVKNASEAALIQKQRRLLSEIFYTNESFQMYQNGKNALHENKMSDAIQSFEKALAKEPDNVAVLIAYAEALQKNDTISDSKNILQRAMELNPQNKDTRFLLAKCEMAKNPKYAVELLRDLAVDKDASEQVSLLFAEALEKTGGLTKAADHLKNKISDHQDWLLSTFLLAKIYARMDGGQWMARKYFMTFQRRAKSLPEYSEKLLEAQAELEKLERKLEIKST